MVVGQATQALNELMQQGGLMKKEPCVLSSLEILPNLEEHDNAETGFQISFKSNNKQNWYQSANSRKIYIKPNDILNVEVQYISTLVKKENFFLRVMMVYDVDLSEPVVRCQNHSSKDPAIFKNIKYSVLRCENEKAVYHGTVEGKNISNRLSIRLALCHTEPNKDNMITQTVALKFVCQNSCVSRRDTSIIFCLENANGDVLSKRVTPVKICSCPKRDMKNETVPRKRTNNVLDECPKGKKIMKLESEIKLETENENEDEAAIVPNALKPNDIHVTPNGVKLCLDLPNMDVACHVISCAFNAVAGQMPANPDNKDLHSSFRQIKKLLVKAKKLSDQSK